MPDIVLHESDDPMALPTPNAEREANVCDDGGALRHIRDGHSENVELRLTAPHNQSMPTVATKFDSLGRVRDRQGNNGGS
jgi:hypothetical protein